MAYTNSPWCPTPNSARTTLGSAPTALTASRRTAWWVSAVWKRWAISFADLTAGKQQLRHRRRWSGRDVCRGEKPLWCSSLRSQRPESRHHRVCQRQYRALRFKNVVYQRLIELCTDICRRNGKTKLLWLGDKTKTLSYTPKSDEMVLTVHRWFANKSCPGNWMYARMGDLASKVTAARQRGEAGRTDQANRHNQSW